MSRKGCICPAVVNPQLNKFSITVDKIPGGKMTKNCFT